SGARAIRPGILRGRGGVVRRARRRTLDGGDTLRRSRGGERPPVRRGGNRGRIGACGGGGRDRGQVCDDAARARGGGGGGRGVEGAMSAMSQRWPPELAERYRAAGYWTGE